MDSMVLVCMLMALALGAACWFQWRRSPTMGLDTLRVPLIAFDHRVQLALSDANAGFVRCKLCEFENFKRFPFCSLCGEEIDHATKQFVYFVNAVAADASRQYTRRQKRARNRKEWLRKVDAEGMLFWYRRRVEHTANAPRLAGYTLHFMEDQVIFAQRLLVSSTMSEHLGGTMSPLSGGQATTTSSPPPRVVVDVFPPEGEEIIQVTSPAVVQPVPVSIDAILDLLTRQAASTSHILTRSQDSDPVIFAVQAASDQGKLHDTLRVASDSFPTKFADFVVTTVGLMVPASSELITLNIRRESLLADSVEALSVIPRKHIRSSFRVNFVDERGVDAGGIYREWSVLLNQRLADAATGIFRCVDVQEQIFYLNSNSAHDIGTDHLVYFFATGRQVGRALLSGQVLGFHLALPLLKIILGLPVSFNDLEYFDPQAYQSMLWILSNDGVDALGLTFSITEQRGEEMVEVDLVDDGRNIQVTDANKEQYLQRRFQYLLYESVSSQLYVFLKGIYEVLPPELLMLFDPEEFDYVLCGSDEIDVGDWQRNTRYSGGQLYSGHELVKWFYEIVREMPNEYRRRLLHFATGSSRVPIEGFSGLTSIDGRLYQFTLKGVPLAENEYIWGHACFNQLDLPYYESREKLKMMLFATLDTDIQGFTTD